MGVKLTNWQAAMSAFVAMLDKRTAFVRVLPVRSAQAMTAWVAALQALLPPGQAFSRAPSSLTTKLLTAIAALLVDAKVALDGLAAQFDPRRATDLLPDWEQLLGLPDSCASGVQSESDRQQAAFQPLTEQGGQSRAYFTQLAALLGEPSVTITEFRPVTCNDSCDSTLMSDADAYVWRVNIPRQAQNMTVATCNSNCDSPLQTYAASVVECPFGKRKPAHTSVLFSYQD